MLWDNRDFIADGLSDKTQNSEVSRIANMSDGFALYEGGFKDPLRRIYNRSTGRYEPYDNVVLNKYKDIIDSNRNSLIGDAQELIGFDQRVNERIVQDWKNWESMNRFALTMIRLVVSGSISGQWAVLMGAGMYGPRIQVLDPLNVQIIYDADDFEMHVGYVITWNPADGGKPRRKLITVGESGKWQVEDQVASHARSEDWQTIGMEVWPYDF
jgi:hypothetical protein